jgi:hypothetical protein
MLTVPYPLLRCLAMLLGKIFLGYQVVSRVFCGVTAFTRALLTQNNPP